MRVLSVDIDVFVDPVASDIETQARLSPGEYTLDRTERIRDVLRRCGLSSAPTRGVFMKDHDDAFSVLRALTEKGDVSLELIHVDAHSDIGLGDSGYQYLLTRFAHLPVEQRRALQRGQCPLNLGNWLAFAVACQWISSILHVRREAPADDLLPMYFADWAQRSTASRDLAIVPMTQSELDQFSSLRPSSAWSLFEHKASVARADFEVIALDDLEARQQPDFVIVCQSPGFTLESADSVMDLCRPMIAIDPVLQKHATPPLGFDADMRRNS
jgi:hypothetical protein